MRDTETTTTWTKEGYFDVFTDAYLEAARWADMEEAMYADGYAPEAERRAFDECRDFIKTNWETLKGFCPEATGHDFWLTRVGHGAGFWDGDYPEPAATILTRASDSAPYTYLYIGDDNLIYFG